MFRGGDVRITTGDFGRIGLAGGDTFRANSFSLLAWIPFLGITYRLTFLFDVEDGSITSLEVVGNTGISVDVIILGATFALVFDDLIL